MTDGVLMTEFVPPLGSGREAIMNERIYDDNDTVFELYLFETNTLLDRFDDMLRAAKADGSLSSRAGAEIGRIMKTVKTSSDMMRFNVIADIAFETENLFYILSGVNLSEVTIGKFADAGMWISGFIRAELKRILNGESGTADEAEELIGTIKKFADFIKTDKDEISEAAASDEPLVSESVEAAPIMSEVPADDSTPEISAEIMLYRMHVYFYEDSRMENVRAYLLADKLSKIGKIEALYPENVENDPETAAEINENGYYIALETHLTREQLEKIMKGTLSVESVSFVGSMPNYEPEADVATTPGMTKMNNSGPNIQEPRSEAIRPQVQSDSPKLETEDENVAQTVKESADDIAELSCIRVLSGDEIYSLPISSVRESFAVRDGSEVDGVVTHRGVKYPYIRISEKLGTKNAIEDISEGMMLVITRGERESCLFVDDILDTVTVTRKSLPSVFDDCDTKLLGITGCALRGVDDISLIIDPAIFLRM
jgi:chemotaxis protein histidine kinase CheA